MSTLIAIAYPDESTAQQVRAALGRLQSERSLELEDFVIAVNEGNRIRLNQAVSLPVGKAMGGAFWGGLFGLLFLSPIAGMAIGAATGAIAGHFSDYGIDDNFVKELGRELKPGQAALFLLIKQATPDKVIDEVKQYEGTILRTNLSNDAEEKLKAALAGSAVE